MGYLKYKGYTGSVEYSEEDNCLFGKVQGMTKDSITYEGATVDELTEDFHGAVDDYLQLCEEKGIAPRKPYTGVLNVRLTPEIHCGAAMAASKEGITINAFIKPEALIGGKDITWSRHITAHDRIIYDIYDDVVTVLIVEVEGHYKDK